MPTKQYYIDNYGEEWYIKYRKHWKLVNGKREWYE